MPDGSYAPQSPDLSSFLTSSSPKKPQTSSYVPRSPKLSAFTTTTGYRQPDQPQQSSLGSAPPSILQQHQQQNLRHVNYNYAEFSGTRHTQSYAPPIPDLPPSHSFSAQQIPNFHQSQSFSRELSSKSNPQVKSEPGHEANSSLRAVGQFSMAARSKRGAAKNENGEGSAQSQIADAGPSQGIDIKTKFPVARIKRIMQADEEVGKVAQVTPVAVSKALELFMISLVTKSASMAKSSSSKRITAQHLKKAIEADEQFDFLNEIVSRVSDGPDAGGKRVKSEDASDDEMDVDGEKGRGGAAGAKKTRGRRKKGE